jgi:AraC-like DNA-binding protein
VPAQASRYPAPGIHVLACQRVVLADWTHASLQAPFWRFYWDPRPGAAVSLGGERVCLDPRRCMAIPPHTPFASESRCETEQFYLHFLAGPPYDRVAPALFVFPLTRELREVLARASAALEAGGRRQRLQLGLYLQTLACFALSRVPDDKLGTVYADARVRAAIQRFEEDPAAPHPNDVLADEAHMNTNAFIRLFRRQVGEPPQAFLLRKRIERACILLHTTDASIEEIAEDTGFCDRYHFSKAFKRMLGLGPAGFRKRQG